LGFEIEIGIAIEIENNNRARPNDRNAQSMGRRGYLVRESSKISYGHDQFDPDFDPDFDFDLDESMAREQVDQVPNESYIE